MLWLLLMSSYMVANVWYTLMLKSSPLPKADKYVTYAVMASILLITATIPMLLGLGNFHPTSDQIILLLRQVGFYTGVNLLNIIALNHTDASIFTIINSLRIVLVTILSALFLKDLPPTMQIIGGAFILVSILILKLHKDKRYLSKPILLSIGAMILVSVNVIAEKHLLGHIDAVSVVFWTSLVIAPSMWTVVLLRRGSLKRSIQHLKNRHTYWLMIMRPASAWSYTLAVQHGSVAVTNYISSLSVVFVVLFGIFYLKEHQQMQQKIVAISIAFVGLTLILISKL